MRDTAASSAGDPSLRGELVPSPDRRGALITRPHLAMPAWVAVWTGIAAAFGAIAVEGMVVGTKLADLTLGAPIVFAFGFAVLAYGVDRAALGRSLPTPLAQLLTTWLVLRLLVGIVCIGLWVACLGLLALAFVGGSSRIDVLLLAAVYLPGWILFGIAGNSAAGPAVEKPLATLSGWVAGTVRRVFPGRLSFAGLCFALGASIAAGVVYMLMEIEFVRREALRNERATEFARKQEREMDAERAESARRGPKLVTSYDELPTLVLFFAVGKGDSSGIVHSVAVQGKAGTWERSQPVIQKHGDHSQQVGRVVARLSGLDLNEADVTASADPTGDARRNLVLAAHRSATAVAMLVDAGIKAEKIVVHLKPAPKDACPDNADRELCIASVRRVGIQFSGHRRP